MNESDSKLKQAQINSKVNKQNEDMDVTSSSIDELKE